MMNHPKLRGKRYIALARCSTKGQADTSIDDQLGVIAAFAREHDMVHVDNIRLEGVTGSIPGARSDIDSLIERKNRRDDFEVVVVQDATRLTRSGPLHAAKVEYDLGAVGITVVYALDNIPEGDFGEVMKSLLHMSGRQQAKSISMASARGSMSSLLHGRSVHCRRPPYGIDRLYLTPDGKPNHIIRNVPDGSQVMLDPETKQVVRAFKRNEKTGAPNHYQKQKDELVQLIPGDEKHTDVITRIYRRHHVDNWGYPRIACDLNDDGVPSPTGKLWHVATIRNILINPIYTGLGIANRHSSAIYHQRAPGSPQPVSIDTRTLAQGKRPPTKVRPRDEWHERKEQALLGLLPPEVRSLAEACHDRHLDEMADGHEPIVNKDRHRDSEYLLKGILMSKQGLHPMTGRLGGRKPNRIRYYSVSRAFNTPKTENAILKKMVPAEPLEKMVLAILQTMLLRAPDLRERVKDAIRNHGREAQVDHGDVAKLKEEREAVRRKLEFAIDELDEIGRDAVKARVKRWQAQLRSLDSRVDRYQPVGNLNKKDVDFATDAVIQRIVQFGETMDELPVPATRRLLEAVVHRAVVDLETRNVELELRLPSWLMEGSKPMCLDTTFACQTDIEAHRENEVRLMKMQIRWLSSCRDFVGYDFADAA